MQSRGRKIYYKFLQTLLASSLSLTNLVASAPAFSADKSPIEIGIDRSNLSDQKEDVRKKTIEDIHALGAQWFRDGFPDHPYSKSSNFVDELKQAKQLGLKVLVTLGPNSADFDKNVTNDNAGDDFCKRCGWPQGSRRYSQINLKLLEVRLRQQFDQLKAAGVDVDAFEIGNEVNWICFNGDVPNGHVASEQEFLSAVRGYAKFLKTTGELIKDRHYFPDAQIVLFGLVNSSDPKHSLSGPEFVAKLKNAFLSA
jgi:hypothetical protein